ncbi:low molecular weight phosphotyrosine protein phosphatase [Xylanimonas oleitrophica]|uniref:protein-tyrosine-phosphatase n=2 Tax=Xylanimonas oleitrophica TaxID=2607479 RepID=A0A2W5WPY8_9MICO|nr:low molecular weight phosphotyrosine protein phosphatase [Xylanimonas oleitrophica]
MTVCTGNICRSPMAEIVLRQALDAAGLHDVVVDSSGVSDEERGNPVDRRARRVLAAHGYPVGDGHRAHQVTADEVASRDLLLPMTAHHARALRRLAAAPDGTAGPEIRMFRSFDPDAPRVGDGHSEHLLDVDDPWYGGMEDFEACLAEIEAAVPGVVEHVRHELEKRSSAPA